MGPSWCPQQPFFEFFPIWPLFPPKNDKNRFLSPPVHALINDRPKKVTGINCDPWPTFWQQQNLTYFNIFEVCAFWQISKASCVCPNSWPTKNKLQAPTRAHDLLFWPKKIWPTLLFPSFIPPNTFPNLPVHALINYPPEKSYRHQLGPMTHLLMTKKIDLLLYFRGSGLQTHFQSFLCMP